MGEVILLSLAASLNPTLVAATTVMLLLPDPSKLMVGYLLGALMTSITLGDASTANMVRSILHGPEVRRELVGA